MLPTAQRPKNFTANSLASTNMPGLITMSCLGSKGRAGNTFFQWVFGRAYAMAIGAEFQTPSNWFGRRLFKAAADEPSITRELPKTVCDSVCPSRGWPVGYFLGKNNIDIDSYCQHQIFLNFYSRQQVREWLKFKSWFENYAPPIHLYFNSSGPVDPPIGYTAMHIRNGDYTTDPMFQRLYATIAPESYYKALEEFNIPGPVMEVFEGRRQEHEELKEYELGWVPDFLMLRDAAYLLRANSTFSWWAGALGHGTVYSPLVKDKVGLQYVEFVCGNYPTTAGIFKNQSDLHLRET